MKKHLRQTITLLLTLILLFTAVFAGDGISAKAASAKWRKACKVYTIFLAKNQSDFKAEMGEFTKQNQEGYKKADAFLLVDLDKNGIPELVTKHPYAYKSDYIYVYTCKGGKVTQIKGINGEKGETACINISSQADGRYYVYKCRRNHLHAKWSSANVGTDESIYTVGKGKIKLYAKGENVQAYGIESYQINGKKVSAKKYRALLKKCGNYEQSLNLNTKTNRKRYIK